jgi:hypothetical protein
MKSRKGSWEPGNTDRMGVPVRWLCPRKSMEGMQRQERQNKRQTGGEQGGMSDGEDG